MKPLSERNEADSAFWDEYSPMEEEVFRWNGMDIDPREVHAVYDGGLFDFRFVYVGDFNCLE